jgi:lipopolysaccharide export system permease protein
MRILTRYVLIELAKVFLVSLSGLTMLMIVVGLVREAAMQSLPLGQVAWLIPYILPDALRVAVPVTLLLATTSVYGRMSGANEVVAIKAMGISPMVVVRPTIIVAILLSLLTVWLNDMAVSWGRNGARRVVVEAVEEIVYAMLKANRSYTTKNFSIHVRSVDGRRLIRPTLTVNTGDRGPMTVMAEEAEITADHAQRLLRIKLRNFEGSVKNGSFYINDADEYVISLDEASKAQSEGAGPSWLAMWQIPQREELQRKKVAETEQEMAARAAYQMLCGDFEGLTSEEWTRRSDWLVEQRQQLCRLQTEPHRRWSAGFSCLCFAWIGVPMAIRRRNRDFLTSFFMCFLPILIVYYPLLAFSVDGAKNGALPPYAVWLGNLLLALWGAILMRRVVRY